jgi:hypothetical protein
VIDPSQFFAWRRNALVKAEAAVMSAVELSPRSRTGLSKEPYLWMYPWDDRPFGGSGTADGALSF